MMTLAARCFLCPAGIASHCLKIDLSQAILTFTSSNMSVSPNIVSAFDSHMPLITFKASSMFCLFLSLTDQAWKTFALVVTGELTILTRFRKT